MLPETCARVLLSCAAGVLCCAVCFHPPDDQQRVKLYVLVLMATPCIACAVLASESWQPSCDLGCCPRSLPSASGLLHYNMLAYGHGATAAADGGCWLFVGVDHACRLTRTYTVLLLLTVV
jgi:hypothetical protein